MEGYEEGSEYSLKFNIWKTEQDWIKLKEHEAKTESIFKPADKLNNPESQKEATKPNKEKENSTSVWEGHEDKGAITKPISDPNKNSEKPEEVIPNSKTKTEAVMPQLTTCEQTPQLTTVGANAKLSSRPGRATLLWKTLQEAEVVTHVPSVAGVGSKHSPCSSLVAAQVEGTH